MSKYLVTGGAGFIGSNLTDSLIDAGHEVRIIDNFSTGQRAQVNPNAELIKADFTNLDAIKQHFVGIDGVFQACAEVRVEKPQQGA